jgi:hypothetical protein
MLFGLFHLSKMAHLESSTSFEKQVRNEVDWSISVRRALVCLLGKGIEHMVQDVKYDLILSG